MQGKRKTLVAAGAVLMLATAAGAQEVNVYSSRHYDTDDQLYQGFTDETGIAVNRIEGEADELIARMKAEGANSPADVFLTVDAGRIWLADKEGLLQPAASEVLEDRIPASLRHPEDRWFGFSQRARLIYYSAERVDAPPQTYMDLADPKWEGRLCIRSATNIYNLSLMSAMIEHHGPDEAKAWAEGMLRNLGGDPAGGDTDQLRGIVSGECDLAVANSYYYLRAMGEEVEGLTGQLDKIGVVFPNQSTTGAHVNVAAAGVAANAPNKENAVRFLEYLASPKAQEMLANQNNEYPAVPGVPLGEGPAQLGLFRQDTLNLAVLGENQSEAQAIFNEVGFP